MFLTVSSPARRRVAARAATALVAAIALAGCGSAAPASNPAPSTPAITAPPSVTPSLAASLAPSVAPASTAPTGAPPTGDPAAGLTIAAPYTLTAVPSVLQTTLEQQMSASLGAFGDAIKVGFRQVNGGSGVSILMVIAFPPGSLSAAAYEAALAGMAPSMGATFTTTTIDGVVVSKGDMQTGGVAVFHVDDHMLMVIGQTATDALPVATALIKANN